MIISKQHIGFSQKLISLAVIAALSPAHAAEGDNVASPSSQPQVSVSAGLGVASGHSDARALFGQYNGLRGNDEHLLLDIDVFNRDDATGILTTFQGRNLGLDDRELRFSQKKQGDWKYSAEYSELTRHDPRTISTGVKGIGTANLTVDSAAAKTDVNLQTERKSVTLGMEKWLTPYLQFEANFKSEDKNGARLFGRGINCGLTSTTTTVLCPIVPANGVGALLLLPEPIDSNIKQLDAKLNFSGDKFMLSGAYYGSFYTNANGAMNQSITSLVAPNGGAISFAGGTSGAQTLAYMLQPTALPPDNQAHQLSLDGNYAFTQTTRATFKYAKTHATQYENFDSMGLTVHPAGVNDLHGIVDTTLTQLGLTARPMPKLSVLANLRSEDKDDQTPLNLYGVDIPAVGAIPAVSGVTNSRSSLKKQTGKLEASYQLPDNYRATLGADYETVNRGVPKNTEYLGGLAMLREETVELGKRIELRRSMSETLNASISYVSSSRNGSSWLGCIKGIKGCAVVSDSFAATTGGNAPYTVMDRKRDKMRLSADWSPTESLSLQFMAENGKDKYTEPHLSTLDGAGLKDTRVRLYSVDAALALSDMWKLTGYASQGEQANHVNFANGTSYKAELQNNNTTLGIGVRGKLTGQLEVGGDMSYMNDKNRYSQLQATTTVLPDVTFRQTTLRFFGKQAVEKNADIRVDVVHQSTYLNEWTWANNGTSFFYSDNTTVSMAQHQNVAFIGATYIYKLK